LKKGVKMSYDLHIHSNNSDGTDLIDDIIDKASNKGLKGIAIVDHDQVPNLSAKNYKKASNKNLRLIDGVEVSTKLGSTKIHIIFYGDISKDENLVEIIRQTQEWREERNEKLCSNLIAKGFDTNLNTIKNYFGRIFICRKCIATYMTDKKMLGSMSEAFQAMDYADTCVERKLFPIEELIPYVNHKAIIAHPGMIQKKSKKSFEEITNMLFSDPKLRNNILGVEKYPYHLLSRGISEEESDDLNKKWVKIALHYDLIVTSGSDYHGTGEKTRIGIEDYVSSNTLTKKLLNYSIKKKQ
jgi:hypothetical protein